MTACINAMRVLTDPADTGAVCLAMPQDVEGEAYDYPEHFLQREYGILTGVLYLPLSLNVQQGLLKRLKSLLLFAAAV